MSRHRFLRMRVGASVGSVRNPPAYWSEYVGLGSGLDRTVFFSFGLGWI